MRLDTNGDLFPQGTFHFKVIDVPQKGETKGGYAYYAFKFAANVDGEEMPYTERFMVWLMAPLCRALGFPEEEPGVFDFDASWCLGKEIEATIVHEKIEKGPSKGNVVARMKEILAVRQRATAGAQDENF